MNTGNILIISEGPPPIGDTVAEGGALRAWGLAKGLVHYGFTVTFAYRSTFDMDVSQNTTQDSIKITTWNGRTIGSLLENHKIVVMRYAMGEAKAIADRLKPDHILISDSYIPIAIEVAARNSNDKHEVENFIRLQETSAFATRRADYFLYASPAQKGYYIGYLAGLNKLNPLTYKQLNNRMFEVPYGVDPNDKDTKLLANKPKKPTLLWYGAFYSWFDMESLIDSLAEVKKSVPGFKLLIAGAKNPYNKDPGILAHYEKTMKALEKLGDSVEHIAWHPYDKRFEVYAQASAIITWNHEGLENEFAWRTRLMDFVLAERPIITNGGDPLGEDLIERGIALRANTDNLDAVFINAIKNPPKKELFDSAGERYSWVNITKELADTLQNPTRMVVAEMIHKPSAGVVAIRRLKKLLTSPLILIRSVKTYGLSETYHKIIKVLKLRLR